MEQFLNPFPSTIYAQAIKLINEMSFHKTTGDCKLAMYDNTDYTNGKEQDYKLCLVWERPKDNSTRWVSAIITEHYLQFMCSGVPEYESFRPDQFGSRQLDQMVSNFLSHLNGAVETDVY